jgi:prefoldin beta subunit
MVGPVLLKQEKSEATMSVDARVQFIEKEIERVEGQIAEVQGKMEGLKGEIIGLQSQMEAPPGQQGIKA